MAPSQGKNARELAMDALSFLTNNMPDWLRRLDDLSGQTNKRQADLAAINMIDKTSKTRSLRNNGSQESLKPADDDPSFIPASDETPNAALSAEVQRTIPGARK